MTIGNVYYIENFTAPKLFRGTYFECLLTDQKIESNQVVVKDLGQYKEYKNEVWKPERFNQFK